MSVYDGKSHPVDSKEVAFRTAGKYAFIDAVEHARPALLEPIVNMEISVPSQHMGDIASDLSGRRGRIQGQDMLPGNMCVMRAQAPLAEVMQYNSQLRSVTGGQGSYTMEFSHYVWIALITLIAAHPALAQDVFEVEPGSDSKAIQSVIDRAVAAETKPAVMLWPEAEYEKEGFFPNVVFPTGAVAQDGQALLVYYGAADETTCAAKTSVAQLLEHLGV